MGQGRKRKMTGRIFIHLFIMKLWSNYLQHTGNQSLYKANLQSIQKCAKMSQYLRHSWLSHRFLHFHTSIFDTKKFFWRKWQCQEKRTSCNSNQSHHPIGSIRSLFLLWPVLRQMSISFVWCALTSFSSRFLWNMKTGSLEGQCQQQWLSETSVPKGASFGSSQYWNNAKITPFSYSGSSCIWPL